MCFFMITLSWSLPFLSIAALAALAFDLYCSRLLHLRYGEQFGAGFVWAGLVSFSLPSLVMIGVPAYLILASGLDWTDRLLMLAGLGLCCLWTGWRLRRRVLNRIFTRDDVLRLQERARQERELARLQAEAGQAE